MHMFTQQRSEAERKKVLLPQMVGEGRGTSMLACQSYIQAPYKPGGLLPGLCLSHIDADHDGSLSINKQTQT